MATASSNIKGFYRQKKKESGIRKPTSTKSDKSSLLHAATLGSDFTPPSALVPRGSPDLKDDYDKNEDVLRQFDMNSAYGTVPWDVSACSLGACSAFRSKPAERNRGPAEGQRGSIRMLVGWLHLEVTNSVLLICCVLFSLWLCC
ncbi:hypothetical protein OIU84_027497 [Salix udensis]|uniref:Uncharacterized protein n=1 Tax=Salix udensis TaxID=889485 RepID=A0AAD6KFM7_9ROSI|nr:hypothetical protein OIU84_027497 [Salix udensis]